MSETPVSPAPTKSDTERLHELGYAQELGRKMQGFSNMAVSFWALSARKWFAGPKIQGSPEELRAIEADLEAAAGA